MPEFSGMAATIRRVVNPTDDELDRAAWALSEAFGHSYFVGGLGGDKSLVPPLLRGHITAALIGGEVYLAEIPGQGIVGGAVWFGPGQYFLDSDEQRNAGWNQVMQKLDAKYTAWWDYFLDTYAKFCERVLGPGTKRSSYHLQVLGVVPEHQKKGIGSALINVVENVAKPKKVGLCVETMGDLNVKIYKSLGFSLEGDETMKSAAEKPFVMFCLIKRV